MSVHCQSRTLGELTPCPRWNQWWDLLTPAVVFAATLEFLVTLRGWYSRQREEQEVEEVEEVAGLQVSLGCQFSLGKLHQAMGWVLWELKQGASLVTCERLVQTAGRAEAAGEFWAVVEVAASEVLVYLTQT
jgi:hypothetical protein